MKKPIVWTIAGSDSGGFAGIQADLKTFQLFDVHGCSVITAITAQNRFDISATYFLPQEFVQAQINTLMNDLPPRAIKIGMLGNVSHLFHKKMTGPKIILDPIISSTSGHALHEKAFQHHLEKLEKFFPRVDVLTPNIHEAEKILGVTIRSYADVENAARKFLSSNIKSVLIKGGHFNDSHWAIDYWTDGQEAFWMSHARYTKNHFHGTGCTLSSAITAALGLGYDIKNAIVMGKMLITKAIRESVDDGLSYTDLPRTTEDLPYLSHVPISEEPKSFPSCGQNSLGLYPVVDSAKWLKKLLPLGITTIQLRNKNLTGCALEQEIQQAIEIANAYQARLFINDYWDLAIKHQAYGVHLGQEDLQYADINAIHSAGLRLGISTHSYEEVVRAHALRPSYMAFGPIFATTSKIMPFAPQGITKLQVFRDLLDYPLVAIGGINHHNLANVLATGVSGVAMISAITAAPDPISSTNELLKLMSEMRS
jgi:hydroxymethylpyrimidine kinase/phosphomethylpyrimidine kinase/thiamine-phosphate diphosphorylase